MACCKAHWASIGRSCAGVCEGSRSKVVGVLEFTEVTAEVNDVHNLNFKNQAALGTFNKDA